MKRGLAAATLALSIVTAACGGTPSPEGGRALVLTTDERAQAPAIVKAAALERFSDCREVVRSLGASAAPYVGAYGFAGALALPGRLAATAGAAMEAGDSAAGPAAPGIDHSETNVQEEGVDEPDTVETDGRRIFAVTAQKLRAIAVEDGKPRLAGTLDIGSYGAQLLLAGDRLMVIGEEPAETPERPVAEGGPAIDLIGPVPASQPKTLVQIVDVADPGRMRVVSSVHLDGGYVTARATGGVARIVLRRGQPDIVIAQPADGTSRAAAEALAANRDAVKGAKAEAWIPRFELESSDGKKESGPLSSCADTYRPPAFSGPATVTVTTIDPRNPTPRDGSTVVGGADIVYASKDALYVTSTKQPEPVPLAEEPAAPGGPDTAVVRPEPAPVSPSETQIHKFDIRGTKATYVASGLVKGTLINQFALSELAGNLRVATTTQPAKEGEKSESFVRVLAQAGKALVEVGRVGGLGKGENIYAVRFLADVGYVVTFRQIDPLYTVDLSNPRLPRVVGELKIPGFSSYLHPVGDGLVLGVGQEAKGDNPAEPGLAVPTGTKVSLFDVSDAAHPKELASKVLTGGHSDAEYDHHAFLWWAPRQLAVLPVSIFDQQRSENGFVGAIALRVDRTKIDEVGRLSHPEVKPAGGGVSPPGPAGAEPGAEPTVVAPDQASFAPAISRALVAQDTLFTVSEAGVQANDLGSLRKETWVPFPA